MYARFAEVYDRLMGDFDYAGWAAYYLELLGRAGLAPETVCECACGTGSMSLELVKRGRKLIGVDSSPGMLRQAADKARAAGVTIPFVCQDMRELALHRPVDAILCPCDGVNYLLTRGDLARFFSAARENLRPGGVLAFDISSAHKLRLVSGGFFGEDLGDLAYLWQNQWDQQTRTVQMELCFFLRRPDGLYARFDERQAQRAHEAREITDALEQAGFREVSVFGDRHFAPPGPEEARIHFSAVNP